MATLKESLQAKVDTLGIGTICHLHDFLKQGSNELFVTNTGDGISEQNEVILISAQTILKEPKIYKSIFCLDNLGIDKSIKSVVIEVKDSTLRIYYLQDSSCFFIEFQCNYQTLELVKELPIEVIRYLRILCSKKGTLELIVKEDILLILFEDTFPSKMPIKERKEKKVDKYVLAIPLKEVDEFDRQVVEFSCNLVYRSGSKTIPIGQDIPNLPIYLSTIICPSKKEPIEYWGTIIYTDLGEFIVVDTLGLPISIVICPTLISNSFINKIDKEVEVLETNELPTLEKVDE